jgi:hypothetical protein
MQLQNLLKQIVRFSLVVLGWGMLLGAKVHAERGRLMQRQPFF